MFDTFGDEKERRIFNRSFWHAFYFGAGLFLLTNVIAFYQAAVKYAQYVDPPIQFSPVGRRFLWGFPFHWQGDKIDHLPADGIVNILFLFLLSFVCGVAFRRILKHQRSE